MRTMGVLWLTTSLLVTVAGSASASGVCEATINGELTSQGQDPAHLRLGTTVSYDGLSHTIVFGDTVPHICAVLEQQRTASIETQLRQVTSERDRAQNTLDAMNQNPFIRHWLQLVIGVWALSCLTTFTTVMAIRKK